MSALNRRAATWALLALLVPIGLLGCPKGPALPRLGVRDQAITLREVQDEGDDRRRASSHLVLEGLDADDRGEADRALDRYELSLTVDPGNPWSYLALARHELDRGDPTRALAALDRCRSLLDLEGPISPRVETHLLGLRGAALEALGRFDEARPILSEARRRAPSAWGDGYLSAAELR